MSITTLALCGDTQLSISSKVATCPEDLSQSVVNDDVFKATQKLYDEDGNKVKIPIKTKTGTTQKLQSPPAKFNARKQQSKQPSLEVFMEKQKNFLYEAGMKPSPMFQQTIAEKTIHTFSYSPTTPSNEKIDCNGLENRSWHNILEISESPLSTGLKLTILVEIYQIEHIVGYWVFEYEHLENKVCFRNAGGVAIDYIGQGLYDEGDYDKGISKELPWDFVLRRIQASKDKNGGSLPVVKAAANTIVGWNRDYNAKIHSFEDHKYWIYTNPKETGATSMQKLVAMKFLERMNITSKEAQEVLYIRVLLDFHDKVKKDIERQVKNETKKIVKGLHQTFVLNCKNQQIITKYLHSLLDQVTGTMDYEKLSEHISIVTECLAKIKNATKNNNTYTLLGASTEIRGTSSQLKIQYDPSDFTNFLELNVEEELKMWPCLQNIENIEEDIEAKNQEFFMDDCKKLIEEALPGSLCVREKKQLVNANAKKLCELVKMSYEEMKEPKDILNDIQEEYPGAIEFCELAYKDHIENLSPLFLKDSLIKIDEEQRAKELKFKEEQAEAHKKLKNQRDTYTKKIRELEDMINELEDKIEIAETEKERQQHEELLENLREQKILTQNEAKAKANKTSWGIPPGKRRRL